VSATGPTGATGPFGLQPSSRLQFWHDPVDNDFITGVDSVERMIGGSPVYTPGYSGRYFVIVTGTATNSGSGSVIVTARYDQIPFHNYSEIPNKGDPVKGLAIGQPQEIGAPGMTIGFTIMGFVTVDFIPVSDQPDLGVREYWFDLSVKTTAGSGGGVRNTSYVLMEL
jgi:hypothetical protein